MLDEFRHIAETAMPQPIQSRLVTPSRGPRRDYELNRLTDGSLSRELPVVVTMDDIIEILHWSQTKKQPSLHTYMNGAE